MPIQTFKDLVVWQKGHEFVLYIYMLTKKFPREETFALTDQMRRAAVSITSNIAEGFSRQSYKDKTYFYIMAQGSLTELQNQLLIAKDIGYIPSKEFEVAELKSIVVHKLLSGIIKSSKSRYN